MPSEIRLSIAPDAVALVRVRGLWARRARSATWRPVTPVAGQPAWVAALAALAELLQASGVKQARCVVILANPLVRYLVVPAEKDLATEAEQIAYARARFAQIHGDAAREWDIRIGRDPVGTARLAAAIDAGLLGTLRSLLEARKLRLEACRPALTATFDAMRGRIAEDAWIIAGEAGRVLVARLQDGQWASVRVRPLEGDTLVLSNILAQERMLVANAGGDSRVYVSAAEGLRIEAEDVPAQVFGIPHRGGLAPGLDTHATLALAGMA